MTIFFLPQPALPKDAFSFGFPQVYADWYGEQQVNNLHRFLLVNHDQTEPLELWDRVNPSGEVAHEVVETSASASLCSKGTNLLLNGYKP